MRGGGLGAWTRLASVVGAVALFARALPAMADDAPPSTANDAELIVTGTRLPKADYSADSPIVTLTDQDLQRRAAVTLEEVLNRLPQVVPSYSSASNNPSANGASYVDLRGLGVSRNLVLLDGRRMVGANASSSVDLNTIPSALIERVEIVTGGASAVYGADAVAGVVNIRLKPSFEGLQLDGRTLVSQLGDGQEHELSLTYGHRFSRLSLMGSIGLVRRDEIGKGARPFSSQADSPSSFLPSGGYLTGPNQPSLAAINSVFGAYGVAPGLVSRTGGLAGFSFNADGTLFSTGVPGNPLDVQNYRGGKGDIVASFYPDVFVYNYQPFNKLILPLDRTTAFASASYEATERIRFFGQALYTRYTASTALAPSPAPTDPNPLYPGQSVIGFTIPVTNPFIPKDLATLLASRTGNSPALPGAGPTEDFVYRFRTVALGPRQSDNTAEVINLLGGAKVELNGGWRAEAYAGWGRYDRVEQQSGLLSVRRFEQLLYSPTGGKDLCDGGFNPFGGALGASCADFLKVSARFTTAIELADASASVTGPLWRLPAGPVMGAFGAEYRRVSYVFTPPAGLTPGEVAGFIPLSGLAGSIATGDFFAEANAPLLADRPLARKVELTLGYRLSGDAGAGIVHSYKAELGWSVDDALRLRAAYQHAVRSPDIFERYQPPTSAAGNVTDPCAPGPLRTAPLLALCQAQAVALGFQAGDINNLRSDSFQTSVTQSGNAGLRPEGARTITVGAVWRRAGEGPWIGALQATLDGYDIEIDNAIGYQDPQSVINGCYNVGGATNASFDPASPYCGRFSRSGVDFSIANINTPQSNQTRLATSGIDAALAWRTDLAALSARAWLGRLDTTIQVSWVGRFEEQDTPLRPASDFAGTIADANTGYESLPVWKGLIDLRWTSGAFELDAAGRYIGAMSPRNRLIDPTDTTATGVGSAWYWDLAGHWAISRRAEVRAGVLNLFDRGPELYKPNIDAGTDPSTYDVIGRRFWVGLTLRL